MCVFYQYSCPLIVLGITRNLPVKPLILVPCILENYTHAITGSSHSHCEFSHLPTLGDYVNDEWEEPENSHLLLEYNVSLVVVIVVIKIYPTCIETL
ncbi:hypothetical protein GDO86_013273 [Hymenochirus boettgeri]|uniref:Uncharacterized protein n=1 Tax=Hymenochirus boettgeri TaxID=247094 RepID=A0A8T2IUL1_9PIPI|nr:hypothetical protein GDO86_013273 [Hymenochirus boettgeri]